MIFQYNSVHMVHIQHAYLFMCYILLRTFKKSSMLIDYLFSNETKIFCYFFFLFFNPFLLCGYLHCPKNEFNVRFWVPEYNPERINGFTQPNVWPDILVYYIGRYVTFFKYSVFIILYSTI